MCISLHTWIIFQTQSFFEVLSWKLIYSSFQMASEREGGSSDSSSSSSSEEPKEEKKDSKDSDSAKS